MKLREKLRHNPFYIFLFYFIVMFLLDYLIDGAERSWKSSLLFAFLFALLMTFFNHLYPYPGTPVYFKLSYYDEILQELEKQGAVIKKEKGDRKYFKLKGKKWKWPLTSIRLRKTAFYACLEVPEKLHLHFLDLIEQKGAGLYKKDI